ncbi:MAG: Phosphatidate cytidylyltransferase [Candidatus Accumulibacter adjunctus]|uniref:Phosphatidate cytidylyltransferase n=1 Tax=Candidatus Accumulibacter adjunctus TaxID=1454001 RepID=A0A011M829_9PROT|nr:MAG: Phosphatidate cytidylyltransferase [Candidatus Accumulibacter adjunctus]
MDWHAADLLPQPPDEAWRMAAGIAIVLLLATLVARLLRLRLARRQPHALLDNLNQRIDTWWLIAIAVGLALVAGRPGVILLFALASLAALREFLAGDVAAAIPRALRWSGFAIILPLQYLLLFTAPGLLFASLVPLCVLLVLPAWQWLRAAHGGPPRHLRPLQLGLLLCVYCIAHVPALLALPVDAGDTQRNGWLLVFLLLVVQVGDVLQYLWGTLAGRHPIAPRLSPAKTVEGTVGGILSACALGAWLAPLTPFTTAAAAMISLLLGVLGFGGGLLLSALKRQRGIKDWGTLLPGHGGMLDRLDSLCLSAPVFYYLLRFGYGG